MALSGEKASIFNFGISDMLPKSEERVGEPVQQKEKTVKKEKKQAKQSEIAKKKDETTVIEPKKPAEGDGQKEKKEPNKTVTKPPKSVLNIPTKKGHGVAKSVYFDDDNFAYIEEISRTNDVKFSVILNILIKQFREEHNGK